MGRIIIGAVAAAIAAFVIGFALHGSGLQAIAYGSLTDEQAASVQQSLARNLPRTGTYIVPDDSSARQIAMYTEGPIATVHFNARGAPLLDAGALGSWLLLVFLVALLVGAALWPVSGSSFRQRSRLVLLFAIAAAGYGRLSQPTLYHLDWGHFIYMFATDALVLAVIGLITARFVPEVVESRKPLHDK